MLRFLDGLLEAKPKPVIALLAAALLIAVGMADYITGRDVSLSLFYAAPVLLATWYGSRWIGVCFAFGAAITWLIAQAAAGYSYPTVSVAIWNTIIRSGFLVIVALLLAIIRRDLDRQERLAVTDSLTGLANLRAFNDRLHAEAARSRRYGYSLTLLYIDVDNFKSINDTRGHDAGDQVLKTVARTIANNVRQSDLIARLGGDEFAGLFPEADYEAAGALLEKIRNELTDAMSRQASPVTFSIGAITFDIPLENIREMLKAADDLMYGVKKQGKNNVVHQRCN